MASRCRGGQRNLTSTSAPGTPERRVQRVGAIGRRHHRATSCCSWTVRRAARLHASVVHSVSSCATRASCSGPSAPRAGHIASISASRITTASRRTLRRRRGRRRASPGVPGVRPGDVPGAQGHELRAPPARDGHGGRPGRRPRPCRSTPRGKDAPSAAASAAYRVGQTTHSLSVCSASSAPAMRSEAEGFFGCFGFSGFGFVTRDESRANATAVDATTRTAGASEGSAATTTTEADADRRTLRSPSRRTDGAGGDEAVVKRPRRDSALLCVEAGGENAQRRAGEPHISPPW